MGLDMYLTKKTYIGASYKHAEAEGTVSIKLRGKDIPIQFNRISEISEQVGQWRKANHIHRWFVQNVQDGEDDCKEYIVYDDKLKQLLADCKAVLKNKKKAKEIMPTQSGFFFGGTEYDEYYFEDIKYTIKLLEQCLSENNENANYYYSSSW